VADPEAGHLGLPLIWAICGADTSSPLASREKAKQKPFPFGPFVGVGWDAGGAGEEPTVNCGIVEKSANGEDPFLSSVSRKMCVSRGE